ncbi:hypothetical protein DFA_08237 [Cavenderia fasciculata]|uniref:Peptide deformylase n=1 Tax=Cavenderia fasciculata TaxID=261658 RepID=F4Q5I8_CACFS|nr:uncharacterized protein DFA_08237 [Cavenderia fasciculata]EGG17247.1 hypothetical protein DFA_08237 [Cavenderia fasciculata]|eukprot:XP_004355731.1 hypothetical protein DFA_08237 [Cavenderia fasciculata]
MISKNILKIGNSLLKQVAQPWTKEELKDTKRVEKLLDLMDDVLIPSLQSAQPIKRNSNYQITSGGPVFGKTGIAGSSKNLFNLTKYKRSMQTPLVTTPKKITANNTIDVWESCLSVPSYYGRVTRARKCIINFWDITGTPRSIEADGLISACLQHENDHLLGRVFFERLQNSVNDLVHADELTHEQATHVFSLTGDFQITK